MENAVADILSEERLHLNYVLDYIDNTLCSQTPNEANLRQYIMDERRRIWDDYSRRPDNIELMQANQTLDLDTERYFHIRDKLYLLQKTRKSPYFARIDFRENGQEAEPFYIGTCSLIDHRNYQVLICDWRADISSLYYDAALGPAEYQTEEGTVKGEITLRRQIHIEDSEIKYAFDSGINITDPVLMEALGRSGDAKLKTIVDTIQKEQNQVIRNLDADLLLVQGSAGSGKTSVALHRLAFLLYKYRKTLTSSDTVIFSPSEIFSAYIAEVLPELGEESSVRTDFYHFLSGQDDIKQYSGRSEQIEALLKSDSDYLRRMISEKGSASFAEKLKNYSEYRYSAHLVTEDLVGFSDQLLATKEELKQWFFSDYAAYPPRVRAEKIATRAADTAEERKEEICRKFLEESTLHGIVSLSDEERAVQCDEMWQSSLAELRDSVYRLLLIPEEDLYLDFLKEYNTSFYDYSRDLFADGVIPYEDLFCLSLLRLLSGKIAPMRTVRQVVVDEAQEHPPIAFLLLSDLFPNARFTILGDMAQRVNETIPSVAAIADYFPRKKNAVSVSLNKSYRSTHEIYEFAARFRQNEDVRLMDRHGPKPEFLPIQNPPVEQIRLLLEGFASRGHRTNMILCRTQRECDELYQVLKPHLPVLKLRSFDTFAAGTTVILPIYLSKGLEADGIILYGVSAEWNTEEDRGLLYVAATRAQHELAVLYREDGKSLLF